MSSQPNTCSRVEVPPVGGKVFWPIFLAIIFFFIAVAVYNLRHSAGLSCMEIGGSILWLCIVALTLAVEIAECGGFRRFFINCLGVYSRRAFIETRPQSHGPALLLYGFELLDRDYHYVRIETDRIRMVHWSAGQASGVTGRDCNDWVVAVWCSKDEDPRSWDHRNVSTKDIHIVTPHLAREDAEKIGQSVLEMLNEAGVHLTPTDEPREFVIAQAQETGEQLLSEPEADNR